MHLKLISLAMMVTMSTLTMTTSNPLTTWMMMELTGFAFMALCAMKTSSIKAIPFLMPMQFIPTATMLVSIISQPTMSEMSEMMMSLSVMMKMGLFPFDTWMMNTMQEMSWSNCMAMMTIMKIPPIMMMSMTNINWIMIIMNSISPLIITLKTLKMTSPKMIMALSSGIHSSWMIMTMLVSHPVWTTYFTAYSTVMLATLMAIKTATPNTNWLENPESINNTIKTTLMMAIMTMMGVPPTLLFIMKASAMLSLTNLMIPLSCLIISSSMSLMLYSRVIMTMMMVNTTQMKKLKTHMKPTIIAVSMIIITTTIMIAL